MVYIITSQVMGFQICAIWISYKSPFYKAGHIASSRDYQCSQSVVKKGVVAIRTRVSQHSIPSHPELNIPIIFRPTVIAWVTEYILSVVDPGIYVWENLLRPCIGTVCAG